MDYRCPLCHATLPKRKLSHAIVARMDFECPFCRNRLRLNLHPSEMTAMTVNFAVFVVIAAIAYFLQHERLFLAAVGVVMVGYLALPILERTSLRDWPRYAPAMPARKD